MPVKKNVSEGKLDWEKMDGWEIAVTSNPTPAESYAAEEFQRWLGRRTGRELPIRPGGECRAQQIRIDFDSELEEEEFRIEVEEDRLTIAGGRPRGALYGVYQALEDFLGIRFLTGDHTHVPEGSIDPTPCGTYSYAPPFSFRWSFYRENADQPEFAARLRVNTITDEERLGGKTPQNLINHSVHALVPFEKYGAEHPEYFAMVDGERDTNTHGGGPQLCVTNPEVIEIATRSTIAHLDAHPQLRNFSVSQADTDRYCRCPECEAINQPEGTPMGSQLAFVNAVAEAVEKKYPQVKIGTLAYWYTRQRPKTIRPRANVQIQLCSIECCTVHALDDPNCPRNQPFCRDMDEWGEACNDIWIWNYNTNFRMYDLPFPNLRSIGPNVRYFLKNQAKGIFMQANGNGRTGELSDLRNYVIGRLLWDPKADEKELQREFIELHYGKAGGPIEEYLEMLHDNAEARGVHPNCFPSAEEAGLDAAVAKRSADYFAQALELATDDAIRSRVEKASICAYRALIVTEAWESEEEKERSLDRYIALCKNHGMSHSAERQLADEYFAELKSA
ncbi:MAG: DUF4838 domain-containing protein [Gemmatimonadetes bacterium]|jgi:hypothetical protein|nr:DUF4838 domain-containing protein [Gemmatimonadota bacterium]